jgi:dihydroorotase (multifunctional complex type)
MNSNVDLSILNGTIYTSNGPIRAGIAIENEKIVSIGKETNLPKAVKKIDAKGKIIIPGIVDVHSHIRDLEVDYKEDYEHASKAAAAGGITMHVDMPNVKPPTTTVERFLEKKEVAQKQVIVDFNMFPSASLIEEIPKLSSVGILGYKAFMIKDVERDYPHMPEIGIKSLGHLLEIFKVVAKTGLPIVVHPHSQEIADYIDHEIWKEIGTDPLAYFEADIRYDSLIKTIGVSNIIHLARVTGARVNITHMDKARTIELLRESKKKGEAKITADAHPGSVFVDRELIKKLGPLPLGVGSTPNDREAVWKGWNDGTIDIITSEHAPHTMEEKKIGWTNMWKAPGGWGSEMQEMLPMFLTQINKGRIKLETFIQKTSLNPAKIFGVYPKKGNIQIGSDADITIIDMKKETKISNEKCYSKCGYSPYDGMKVKGVPIMTICRGKVVMQYGEIMVNPGNGVFQPRVDIIKNSNLMEQIS